MPSSQPNLLILMSDQQRADTIAPDSPCLTPHLDALAARGARFERCYTVNPICSPTRASLMTGLLPHSHGMVDCTHTVETYRAKLKDNLPCWAQRLQAAGYRTGYFGKWHVERSERLENFGWETYDLKNHGYREHRQSLGLAGDRNFLRRTAVQQKGYSDFLVSGVLDEPAAATKEYHTYSQGIDYLNSVAGGDQPWCCFLSTTAPHDPYVVPRECFERYRVEDLEQPASFPDDLAGRPNIYRRCQSVWDQLDWPQFAEATACYYALCSHLDDQVGRVLQTFEDLGQLDHTIVLYTSDHGDYLGAHRLLLKGVPAFEEAYRIPLAMAGPGIEPGRVVPDICSILDLPSTLTELTLGEPFEAEGGSLLPQLAGQPGPGFAYAENLGQRFAYTQRVVWNERYKYVFNGFDYDELYDLETDPHELTNLIDSPEHQAIAEDLATQMWRRIQETNDFNLDKSQYGMFRYVPVGPEAGR